MSENKKQLEEVKTMLEKEHGREFSEDEAQQALLGIETIARIIADHSILEADRKKKLITFPKGFHLEDRYTCSICGQPASSTNSWYDKFGIKCMICQNAINKKTVPASVAVTRDGWYSKMELELYFNIKGAYLNKLIKQAFLKNRLILDEHGKVHFMLFLIRDNKGVLPAKKLLQSRTVKYQKEGEDYFTQEYWYEYMDIKQAERLKKYKISDCFLETLSQPINSGRFHYNMNPLFILKQ